MLYLPPLHYLEHHIGIANRLLLSAEDDIYVQYTPRVIGHCIRELWNISNLNSCVGRTSKLTRHYIITRNNLPAMTLHTRTTAVCTSYRSNTCKYLINYSTIPETTTAVTSTLPFECCTTPNAERERRAGHKSNPLYYSLRLYSCR